MKRRLTALGLSLLLGVSLLSVPVSAAERPWEETYANFVRQEIKDGGDHITLIDLDNDGVPELLVGWLAAHGNCPIKSAATFKRGVFHTLTYDYMEEFDINADFTLYTKQATGERKIEVPGSWYSGSYYGSSVGSLWIEGYTLRNATIFEDGTDLRMGGTDYYINGQPVNQSQYGAAYDSRNNGWKKASDFQVIYEEIGRSSSVADIKAVFAKWKDGDTTASPTTHNMTVDGKKVSPAAYNIDNSNYFKLRDIAALLTGTKSQFQVSYNQSTQAITLTTGEAYTSVGGELASLPSGAQKVIPTPSSVYVDGKQVSLTAYNINGNNYFKLRDLGQALGFSVDWDGSTQTIIVKTT